MDIAIRDSEIGPCGGHAVVIDGSSTVTLEQLTIHDALSGILAHNSQRIAVTNSSFSDVGRILIQFDKVTGDGNLISENSGANVLGGSDVSDFVNIYKSSGTPSSPITISRNTFQNGGPSGSGSGILVGDFGGAYIVVQENILRNPGQVGIGVASGTDIRVVGNAVYSASHPWSNVGIYVWNQSANECSSIEVRGNDVEWYDSDGIRNSSWDGGNCGAIIGFEDNNWDAVIDGP